MSDLTYVAERVGRLWARPEVQRYIDLTSALNCGDAPMHNFVGFNLTRDRILNAKVNHHHFRRIDDASKRMEYALTNRSFYSSLN